MRRWDWDAADVLLQMALCFIIGFSVAMICVDNGFRP